MIFMDCDIHLFGIKHHVFRGGDLRTSGDKKRAVQTDKSDKNWTAHKKNLTLQEIRGLTEWFAGIRYAIIAHFLHFILNEGAFCCAI